MRSIRQEGTVAEVATSGGDVCVCRRIERESVAKKKFFFLAIERGFSFEL